MDAAARLLDAHVAHVLRQLRGETFETLVGTEVDHALARAHELTLDEVVHRDSVKDVAGKYVAGFDLPGAIPEVVGEIAARVRSHPANDTPVGDVLPRRTIVAAIEKVAELRPLREKIVAAVAENPSVQTWLAQYLHALATGPIATNRRLIGKVPGMSSALSVGDKLAGGVVREADQRSRELAEKAAAGILQRWREGSANTLRDDDLAAALTETWDRASERSIHELLDALDDDDLVDLVVAGYEIWADLRTTDYLRALIDTGVDYFYDTYGSMTLFDLLTEFGLTREDLVEEALRFAPRAIEALDGAGLLEDVVRRQLAGFYDSPEAREVLG